MPQRHQVAHTTAILSGIISLCMHQQIFSRRFWFLHKTWLISSHNSVQNFWFLVMRILSTGGVKAQSLDYVRCVILRSSRMNFHFCLACFPRGHFLSLHFWWNPYVQLQQGLCQRETWGHTCSFKKNDPQLQISGSFWRSFMTPSFWTWGNIWAGNEPQNLHFDPQFFTSVYFRSHPQPCTLEPSATPELQAVVVTVRGPCEGLQHITHWFVFDYNFSLKIDLDYRRS